MTFHAKRSPSGAKKFLTCAGSLAFAAAIPEELRRPGGGSAANLGTATHSIVEHSLKHAKQPADFVDRIIVVFERKDGESSSMLRPGAKMPKQEADKEIFIVDQAMTETADVCVDYVRARCVELGVAEKELQLETRTNPLPDRDDTSGTADITIPARLAGVLEVVDFKNGYLVVDHEDNDQARAYLLGKAIEYDFEFETYRTTIVQPRTQHAEGPVRWKEYTADELKEFQKTYAAGIKKCEKAEAAFEKITDTIDADKTPVDHTNFPAWSEKFLKAGDHCTFCDAGGMCPTRRKAAEDQALIEFADPPGDIQLPAVQGSRMAVGTTEEQVARILSWAPFLDDLVKAATLYAHRAMEAGYDIPGFKLVARRSNRKLKPGTAKDLADEIVEAGYVKDRKALFSKPELLSGPQIEKLVPKKMRKKFNADFLIKPDNGTAIAPVDDPRASVEPRNPGDDFEDAPEELDFG